MTIFETLRRVFVSEKVPKPTSKILTNPYHAEQNDVSFKQLIDYHDKTPQIQLGVLAYAELITGTEIQVNADDERAKEVLDKWNQDTNFYDKFESLVNTLLICGNAILEKLDENVIQDVQEVDMSTIVGKQRDQYGNLLYYEQRSDTGQNIRLGENRLQKFIEFNLSNYSQQKWGKSLFHSLALPRKVGNRDMIPLIEVLWAIEDAMGAITMNNAYPIVEIVYEGANEEFLEKESEKWRKLKPGDKKISNRAAQFNTFETQGQSKYTDYVTHIEKAIQLGIKFPTDIMTGDFTSRASSNTTEDLTLKLARGFQRYLANKLKKELYEPILEQNGISPEAANISVSFTTQNIIQITPDQMLSFTNSGKVSPMEFREWLKDNTGIDLFDDSRIKQQDDLNMQMKQNAADPDEVKDRFDKQEKILQEILEKHERRDELATKEKTRNTKEILELIKELRNGR